MVQHIAQDPPDGHDERGAFWLCPSCDRRARSCADRANCCFWD